MIIGIDFDNTIVSYDVLFHKVAREQNLIPVDSAVSKLVVRDYLRRIGQEDQWTEMQGYVYGKRMSEALAYDGVIDFMHQAQSHGHEIYIISHKTRYPFLGAQYDLHAAAQAWIGQHLQWQGQALLFPARVFFELTKQEKLARIARCNCDVFIDDLPEILLEKAFPARTTRILFDPDNHHGNTQTNGLLPFRSWAQLAEYFNLQ